MMKYAGMFLLFITSVLVGLMCSDHLKKRVKELERCLVFIDKLKTSLHYQNLPTRELIHSLSGQAACKELLFLRYCSEALDQNNHFPSVWRKSVERCRGKMNLLPEDLELMASLADIVGASDTEGQLSALEMIETLLQKQRNEAISAQQKKGKLYRSLGALAGASMVVLLL